MHRHFFTSTCILIFLLVLSACNKPPEVLPTVRLGHEPQDHHSPLYVAAMNPAYFKEHGGIYLQEVTFREKYQLISGGKPIANVLIEPSTGGDELIRRLAENQLDISFGGVPAILKHIDGGRHIHMASPVMAEGAGLVVRNDLPMATWDEFVEYVRHSKAPLKIGYKSAVTVQNLIFETALATTDIRFSTSLDDKAAQIILLNLNGAEHLMPAMQNGLIDGYVIMQPHLALANAKGVGKTIALLRDLPPKGKWHGHPCCALATNDAFVQLHPELASELVVLLLRAKQFIVDNPAKSAEQIAQWLGHPVAVEELSLPTIDFTVRLNESWDQGVDFWVEAMIRNGRLQGKVRDAQQGNKLKGLIYNQQLYSEASRKLE